MSQVARPDHTTLSQRPLQEVWSLAWPTVVTMTSYTVMQFVDKIMVAQVSPLQVAAHGNGSVWAFVPIVLAFGALSVVNTWVSQNLGAGRPQEGPKYAWAALWLSLVVWVALLLPAAALAGWFFSLPIMGHPPELVRLETGYCRILLVGGVIIMASRGLNYFFFGLHRPRIVTISAIAGNLVNAGLAYLLIFGKAGLPALGLYGAAIGTVVGTAVELAIPAAVFLGPKLNAELGTRRSWRPHPGPIRDLLRIGWPPALQFGNEVFCWAIFMSVLVGVFGADHLTAGWSVMSYMHLSFMPAVGFSVAVSSLVGRYIGAGEPDTAVARARLGLALAVGYMTACGLAFYVFRHPLVGFFVGGDALEPGQAEHIIAIGGKLMICAAVFQTVDAFGITYTGALRGAGDTVWPGMVTIIYSWLFIVAGGWAIVTLAPGLESLGPWIAAGAYIIIYGLTMWWRFESGRWRSIRLVERGGDGRVEPKPLPPGVAVDAPAGLPGLIAVADLSIVVATDTVLPLPTAGAQP